MQPDHGSMWRYPGQLTLLLIQQTLGRLILTCTYTLWAGE